MNRKLTLLILLTFLISILLIGCSDKNDIDVEVRARTYINVSDAIEVLSYNGYRLVDLDRIDNKDGSITITMGFDIITK